MKKTLVIIAIILFYSCDTPSKVVKKETKKKDIDTVKGDPNKTDAVSNLTISFISIGSGIDYKAKQQFEIFLKDFEQKNKVSLTYVIIPWGKEGELDYCFNLTEPRMDQQQKFIGASKEHFKGNALVRIKENVVCNDIKKN